MTPAQMEVIRMIEQAVTETRRVAASLEALRDGFAESVEAGVDSRGIQTLRDTLVDDLQRRQLTAMTHLLNVDAMLRISAPPTFTGSAAAYTIPLSNLGLSPWLHEQ